MQDLPSILPMDHRQRESPFPFRIFIIGLEDETAGEKGIVFSQQRQLVSVIGQFLFGMSARKIIFHVHAADAVEADAAGREHHSGRGNRLVYYEAYLDKKSAAQRENKLKNYGSAWRALKKRILA